MMIMVALQRKIVVGMRVPSLSPFLLPLLLSLLLPFLPPSLLASLTNVYFTSSLFLLHTLPFLPLSFSLLTSHLMSIFASPILPLSSHAHPLPPLLTVIPASDFDPLMQHPYTIHMQRVPRPPLLRSQ